MADFDYSAIGASAGNAVGSAFDGGSSWWDNNGSSVLSGAFGVINSAFGFASNYSNAQAAAYAAGQGQPYSANGFGFVPQQQQQQQQQQNNTLLYIGIAFFVLLLVLGGFFVATRK